MVSSSPLYPVPDEPKRRLQSYPTTRVTVGQKVKDGTVRIRIIKDEDRNQPCVEAMTWFCLLKFEVGSNSAVSSSGK